MSLNEIITELNMPETFYEVSNEPKVRNRENVTVIRYQDTDKIRPNNKHITIIIDNNEELISYNNVAFSEGGEMPTEQEALELATQTWSKILPYYARNLSFMRIDHQFREYTDQNGESIEIPVMWIKFAHQNGTYNWVTIGPNNQIVEIERESEWNYMRGRRSTEMWNYDNWVLAREGKGPQLNAPDALA